MFKSLFKKKKITCLKKRKKYIKDYWSNETVGVDSDWVPFVSFDSCIGVGPSWQ